MTQRPHTLLPLAPHLTTARWGKNSPDEPGRTSFEVDADRILFSDAFRALADKTQVHSLMGNDYTRSRLTHSLEVSRVGRTLGQRLAHQMAIAPFTPQDVSHIVAAACLMHDIGNPPFGHVGEGIISDFFASAYGRDLTAPCTPAERLEFEHFEGNAQGFRVVTRLQGWRPEGGLTLTAATLAAAAKYPWSIEARPAGYQKFKYGYLQADAAAFHWVAQATQMQLVHEGCWRRHPLAYMVEAADDICYLVVDIEDAAHLGLITLTQAEELLLPLLPLSEHPDYHKISGLPRKLVYLRAKAIGGLIDALAEAWPHEAKEVLAGTHPGDLLEHTALGPHIKAMRDFSRAQIYSKRLSPGIEERSRVFLNDMLQRFTRLMLRCENGEKLSDIKELFPLRLTEVDFSSRALWLRALCDALGSMTDSRAMKVAEDQV